MNTIRTRRTRPRPHWTVSALVFLLACGSAVAQEYSFRQTLRASTLGEGQPYLRHGAKVAVDGARAVVADDPQFQTSTSVRTYTRTGRTWTPSTAPDIHLSGRELLDMAMHADLLAISLGPVEGGNTGSVRIYQWQGDRWQLQTNSFPSQAAVSIAVDGNTGIVVYGRPGYNNDRGLVSVNRRQGDGSWVFASLEPTPSQVGARFGSSVAIIAGAVVVGAPGEDIVVNGQTRLDAGAAYVYELTTPNWSQVARLTSPTPQSTAHFGHAVAISGLNEAIPDRILVGAPRENTTHGAVYGYRRVSGSWTQSIRLEDTGGYAYQSFGSGLALDGAYGVIGASTHVVGEDMFQAGAIYGATFNANFTGATLTRRFDPQPEAQVRVGEVVAIDRDGPTLMVGVPNAQMYSLNDRQGIVLLSDGFGAAPDFPPLQRVFDLGQGLATALFGYALDTDGAVLIVGAPYESVGSQWGTGAAYVFRRQGNGLYAEEARLQSPSGLWGDMFGMAVAVRGDIALVGAPGVAGGGTDDMGVVYAYRRSGGAWLPEATLYPRCISPQRSQFGRRIAFDGTRALIGGLCPPGGNGLDLGTDVFTRAPNGSWSGTTIVDASRMGAGAWDAGLAVIGIPVGGGSATNYGPGAIFSFLPDGAGGWTMAGAAGGGTGTQGHGYDLAVSQGVLAIASHAPNFPVTVRRRNGDSFMPEAALIAADLGANDAAHSVAVAGARIAFGVPRLTVSQSQQGAVYLFGYSGGVWTQRQKLVSQHPQGGAFFGHAIAMTNDGTLFVAAPYESDVFQTEGGVQVFVAFVDELFKNGFE